MPENGSTIDAGRALTFLLIAVGLAVGAWLMFGGGGERRARQNEAPAVPMICTCVPAPSVLPTGPLPHEMPGVPQ